MFNCSLNYSINCSIKLEREKMNRREVKIAYIVYLLLKNSTATKYGISKELSNKSGYKISYEYFDGLYREAMETIQKSPMFSCSEKSKQDSKNSIEPVAQTDVKRTSVENQNTPQNDFIGEPLFVEDYSTVVENPQQEHSQIDIDELFSAPVPEFSKESDSQDASEQTVDYTNDKDEVPEIFAPAVEEDEVEVVSDTNSTDVATVPKTSIDKTKIKKKSKSKEVVEAEIVDTVAEDGYKYYDFMDTKVWVDFDKFDRFLKKKYNTDSVEDIDYKLRWYENLLLLNVYYNEMMEKNNAELISLLKENGIEESIYGAPCIRDIKREYGGNFAEFSKEYPDFKESKDIENEDVFWTITEWKKGTATRKYLDPFIGKIKREILEEYDGISEKEIEDTIDIALSNWERDITDVRTRSDNFEFVDLIEFTGCDIDYVYSIDYIQTFLPEKVLLNYVPPMSLEDDFVELLSAPQGDNFKERVKNLVYIMFRSVVKEDEPKTRLWQLSRKIYKDERLRKYWREEIFLLVDDKFGSGDIEKDDKVLREMFKELVTLNAQLMRTYYKWTNYSEFINTQEKWVFEYNKTILESKKDIILKEFEKNGISLQK